MSKPKIIAITRTSHKKYMPRVWKNNFVGFLFWI